MSKDRFYWHTNGLMYSVKGSHDPLGVSMDRFYWHTNGLMHSVKGSHDPLGVSMDRFHWHTNKPVLDAMCDAHSQILPHLHC